MRLIKGIEHRSLRVASHPSGAHLMNRKPRRIVIGERFDVAGSGRSQHLSRGDRHILAQSDLIFTKRAVDLQNRDSPRINLFFVEFHEVIVVRQALAVTAKDESPRTWLTNRLLEVHAESRLRDPTLPAFAMCAALEPVSSHEAGLPGL